MMSLHKLHAQRWFSSNDGLNPSRELTSALQCCVNHRREDRIDASRKNVSVFCTKCNLNRPRWSPTVVLYRRNQILLRAHPVQSKCEWSHQLVLHSISSCISFTILCKADISLWVHGADTHQFCIAQMPLSLQHCQHSAVILFLPRHQNKGNARFFIPNPLRHCMTTPLQDPHTQILSESLSAIFDICSRFAWSRAARQRIAFQA